MKKYIVSTVVPGAELDNNFLKAISNFCHKESAKALFIETAPLYKDDLSDPMITAYGEVLENILQLNKNLAIVPLSISASQIDPITGLDRLFGIEHSAIVPSPKQRLKSIASPSMSYPKVLMSPGAVTKPYYKVNKQKMLSEADHVMGAIVVEIVSDKNYHFRQVQASSDGSFIDLGFKYTAQGDKVKAEVSALIPGDYHCGFTDPTVVSALEEMIDTLKPGNLILHDFFDGISVNHHIEHKILPKAVMGNLNDLEAELKLGSDELCRLSKLVPKVVMVKSNHDEFLDRWLDEGVFIKDNRNLIIGLELATAKAKGNDPLEYGFKKYRKFNNVKFLKSDESYKLTPKKIEFGAHGHLGPNGSRGSTKSIERSYINSVTGHSHSPEIQRNAWVVGTSTYLKLSYNRGPSSWMQTACVVYKNGDRQLINIFNSKWRG